MKSSVQTLQDALIARGKIPEADIVMACEKAEQDGDDVDMVLVRMGIVSKKRIGAICAEAYNVPPADLKPESIPEYILRIIPVHMAKKRRIIAYERNADGTLSLGMRDPSDIEAIGLMEKYSGYRVRPHFMTEEIFQDALMRYETGMQRTVRDTQNNDNAWEHQSGEHFVNIILLQAYEANADGINIQLRKKDAVVEFNIDGKEQIIMSIPIDMFQDIDRHIQQRIGAHEVEGSFRVMVDGASVGVHAERDTKTNGGIMLRFASKSIVETTLENSGLSPSAMKTIRRYIRQGYGMILICGPKHSGKTALLYTLMNDIAKSDMRIMTVEHTVMHTVDGVSHMQVPRGDNAMEDGIRAVMTQNPDVMIVGELTAAGMAQTAMHSAITGILVIATVQANDASSGITALRQLQVDDRTIASGLRLSIGLRSVRRICERCKTQDTMSLKRIKEMGASTALQDEIIRKNKSANLPVWRGIGCATCKGTGYDGTIGLFEILEIRDEIREYILDGAPTPQETTRRATGGTQTLIEDAVQKIISGITSVKEVINAMRASG